jgi:hypothetical protein
VGGMPTFQVQLEDLYHCSEAVKQCFMPPHHLVLLVLNDAMMPTMWRSDFQHSCSWVCLACIMTSGNVTETQDTIKFVQLYSR